MTYVVLLTLCSLGFQQLLRTAQVRRTNVLAVAAVNYMIAAVGSAVLYAFDRADAESISWVAVALGAVNGVLFATHLYIILASYRRADVGITIAVTQCGGALAILGTWLLWDEPMTHARWAAVAMLPLAIMLMRTGPKQNPHLRITADLLLLTSFLYFACTQMIHRANQEYVLIESHTSYRISLWAGAAITSAAVALARRSRITGGDMCVGVPLGLVNAAFLVFMVLSLQNVDAVIVFPILSASTIVLNLIASRILWSERFTRRQVVGAVVATAVICLAQA